MPEPSASLAWIVFAFFVGAIPFSVWLGHLFIRADIRGIGDGNPGTTNAWKAGGWPLGVLVLVLDFFKGAVPVGLAAEAWGWGDAAMVAVALAPVIGHDYSPFLRGRGGKGLAVTFGVWTGLTLAEGPLVLGICMALFTWLRVQSGWAVLFGQMLLLAVLLLRPHPSYLLAVWLGTTALLAWKYRYDFRLSIRVVESTDE